MSHSDFADTHRYLRILAKARANGEYIGPHTYTTGGTVQQAAKPKHQPKPKATQKAKAPAKAPAQPVPTKAVAVVRTVAKTQSSAATLQEKWKREQMQKLADKYQSNDPINTIKSVGNGL